MEESSQEQPQFKTLRIPKELIELNVKALRVDRNKLEDEEKFKRNLASSMQNLLLLKSEPKDEKDQQFFKRANKFCAASGSVQSSLDYFGREVLPEELVEQMSDCLDQLNKEIAYKKSNGIPISNLEVKTMKDLLKIGLLVLVKPKDIREKVEEVFGDVRANMAKMEASV